MEKVYAVIKGNDKPCVLDIEQVKRGLILERDIEKMWCIECGAKAHIYHHESGYISFRSIPHNPGCYTRTKEGEQDENLLVKVKNIYTDTFLYKDLILYGNDRAPAPPQPKTGADGGQTADGEEGLEPDSENNPLESNEELLFDPDVLENREAAFTYKFAIKKLSCINSLFKEIQAKGFSFDMGDGLNAGDLVLDEISLHEIRRTGFGGEKIIIAKRCAPEDMIYLHKIGLLFPGKKGLDYIVLKDAFSTKIENALLFKVKCKNELQNDHFKDLIMGSKKKEIKKDSRKYIVIYSLFKKEANDYNQVYVADITFRQYGLFNDVTIGGNK